MTTTRPAFADAIERHRRIFDEWTATLDRDEEAKAELICDAVNAEIAVIVNAPCRDDAELLRKLRDLVEAERRLTRSTPDLSADWGCIAAAAFNHFHPEASPIIDPQGLGDAEVDALLSDPAIAAELDKIGES